MGSGQPEGKWWAVPWPTLQPWKPFSPRTRIGQGCIQLRPLCDVHMMHPIPGLHHLCSSLSPMWASLARGLPGKKPATHYQNHRFLGPTGAIPPVLSRDDHGAAYRAAGPLPPGCGAAPKRQRRGVEAVGTVSVGLLYTMRHSGGQKYLEPLWIGPGNTFAFSRNEFFAVPPPPRSRLEDKQTNQPCQKTFMCHYYTFGCYYHKHTSSDPDIILFTPQDVYRKSAKF